MLQSESKRKERERERERGREGGRGCLIGLYLQRRAILMTISQHCIVATDIVTWCKLSLSIEYKHEIRFVTKYLPPLVRGWTKC
jgi:hypothetical protein